MQDCFQQLPVCTFAFLGGGGVLCQKPPMPFILRYESTIILLPKKLHYPQQPVTAWNMDFHMVSGGSIECEHQLGLRQLHRSWTSTWFLVAEYDPQYGLQWQYGSLISPWCLRCHGSQTSTWPPVATQTTNVNISCSISKDHRHQHGLNGSMNHRTLSSSHNP